MDSSPTDDVGEPVISEVEPGLWELRVRHGDHDHGLRCRDKATLESSARTTLRFLAEGRMDCQPPTPRQLRDAANTPWETK